MNSSMTAEEPRRVLTGVLQHRPTLAPCPPWCESTDDQHAEDDPSRPFHFGPQIGRFRLWGLEGSITATVNEEPLHSDHDLTPAELRQLAVDALAAAQYIEAHQ